MKIIDITLGRDSGYSTSTTGRLESGWKATIHIESSTGSMYPDAREVPEDIAARMAEAAFGALLESGWLTPAFVGDVIPREIEQPAPPPAPVGLLKVIDDIADGQPREEPIL